jgi:hypothetical protein
MSCTARHVHIASDHFPLTAQSERLTEESIGINPSHPKWPDHQLQVAGQAIIRLFTPQSSPRTPPRRAVLEQFNLPTQNVDHAERIGSRSADTLHVAAAMLAGTRRFLSFDKRQRELARAAGLEVKP